MNALTLFESKIFIAIVSALGGIIVARLLNKRALFTYYVFHHRVGLTADDPIYGSVKVTWNDNPVRNPYLSAVELTNQSMKDFDSVIVRVFTNNTMLLSQRTEIVGTTRMIDFTEEYEAKITVAEGNQPTDAQHQLYRQRRDYRVPTMNRGQKLCFDFLNTAQSDDKPAIWVDVLHKGVKCKFRMAKNQFLGVPQTEAAFAGTVVGLVGIGFVIAYVDNLPVAAVLSFAIGWLVLVPGAYTVKAVRKIRVWLAD